MFTESVFNWFKTARINIHKSSFISLNSQSLYFFVLFVSKAYSLVIQHKQTTMMLQPIVKELIMWRHYWTSHLNGLISEGESKGFRGLFFEDPNTPFRGLSGLYITLRLLLSTMTNFNSCYHPPSWEEKLLMGFQTLQETENTSICFLRQRM